MTDIAEIIHRCEGQRPDTVLGGHYGYYMHNDVSALIAEIVRLRAETGEAADAYEPTDQDRYGALGQQ